MTTPHQLERLTSLLAGRRLLLLSGAGISTESGIPDYRGPERAGRPRKPMTYQVFVSDERARRRYWARSMAGWPSIQKAQPNAGHEAVAQLEACGLVEGVITQNVDGLHQKAGSSLTLELHGGLARVLCLECRSLSSRERLQKHLLELNPDMTRVGPKLAPDGDSDLPEDLLATFEVPPCECGGVLKPDVVFFGENVPKARAAQALAMLDRADALLVLGSSLTVMSGMRFVMAATRLAKPVAIINQGPTRADAVAEVKVEAELGQVLPEFVRELGGAYQQPLPG